MKEIHVMDSPGVSGLEAGQPNADGAQPIWRAGSPLSRGAECAIASALHGYERHECLDPEYGRGMAWPIPSLVGELQLYPRTAYGVVVYPGSSGSQDRLPVDKVELREGALVLTGQTVKAEWTVWLSRDEVVRRVRVRVPEPRAEETPPVEEDEERWVTTAEARELLSDCSAQNVSALFKRGTIKGKKEGRTVLIQYGSLVRYARRRNLARAAGRPSATEISENAKPHASLSGETNWIPAASATAVLGCTRRNVCDLHARGVLRGRREGPILFIDYDSLLDYARQRDKAPVS